MAEPSSFMAAAASVDTATITTAGAIAVTPTTPTTTTTVTQCYPIVVYDATEGTLSNVQAAVTDTLRTRLDDVMLTFKCHIAFAIPSEPKFSRDNGRYEFNFVLAITGSPLDIIACRGALLRETMTQAIITIRASRHVLLGQVGEMRAVVKRKLDGLMRTTRTHITCVGQSADHSSTSPETPKSSTQIVFHPSTMDVEIAGHWEATERARMRSLVLLDQVFGLASASIQIDPKLHPIIAGQQRAYINLIMRETLTNIYIPPPLTVQTSRPGDLEPAIEGDTFAATIHITGPVEGVARVQDLLLAASEAKRVKMLTKHVPCVPRKLDWLFMHRKKQIRKIMSDNGACIVLPPLGSNSNIVAFFCEHPAYLERAIRSLMQLTCEYYIACIQLHIPDQHQRAGPSVKEVEAMLLQVSHVSGAEIVYQHQFIEIYGLGHQAKRAYQDILEADFVRPFVRDTKFQIELALEHREFINGKKNGKINKIIKASNCRIVFQDNYNDYNMLIDMYSPIPVRAITGLQMLEDELPAEISFYIPETYHKRIIGVGGKNIQKIMKKYGVYVKFSSAEEYTMLGGYYENEDNVIARTPAKNGDNLKDLKFTIVESINALDLLEAKAVVELPRQLHCLFAGYQGRTILDIETQTRIRITLPDCELGSDTILLEGPESQIELAKLRIQAAAPAVFDFDVPSSPVAQQVFVSHEFIGLAQRLKDELNIAIHIYAPVFEPEPVSEFTIFLIHPISLQSQSLVEAKNAILALLARNQAPLSSVARSGSYANLAPPSSSYDTFQHFNSKLIAAVTTAPESQPSNLSSSFGLFGNKSSNQGSLPNLRQLFDEAPSMTPGLKRSGSEVKPQISAIGRPRNISSSNVSRTIPPQQPPQISTFSSAQTTTNSHQNDHPDFIRHPQLHRPSLTMPDLFSLGDSSNQAANSVLGHAMITSEPSQQSYSGRSNSISTGAGRGTVHGTNMGQDSSTGAGINVNIDMAAPPGAGVRGQTRWSAPTPPIGKSLSSNSMLSGQGKPPLRATMPFSSHEASQATNAQDDDDLGIDFDPKIVDDVIGMDAKIEKDFGQISQILTSIGHTKYLPQFIEHEVDFLTFLTLEDSDLKELGIKALGSRKKILAAIQECNNNHHQYVQQVQHIHSSQGSSEHQQHIDNESLSLTHMQDHSQNQGLSSSPSPPHSMPSSLPSQYHYPIDQQQQQQRQRQLMAEPFVPQHMQNPHSTTLPQVQQQQISPKLQQKQPQGSSEASNAGSPPVSPEDKKPQSSPTANPKSSVPDKMPTSFAAAASKGRK